MSRASRILVVERVEADAERASVELRVGPRLVTVELGLAAPELTTFERLPEPLDVSDAARRAVIDVVRRVHDGDGVTLPVDLSDVVRAASERWPQRAPGLDEREALDLASAGVPATVARVDRDVPDAGVVTVTVQIGGRDAVVVVDPRDAALRFRFARGVHPWQLSAEEARAMLRALVGALRP